MLFHYMKLKNNFFKDFGIRIFVYNIIGVRDAAIFIGNTLTYLFYLQYARNFVIMSKAVGNRNIA